MDAKAADLADQALSLPISDRVLLAQRLWESLSVPQRGSAEEDETAALALAKRRDAELASGKVEPRSHEQVMKAAREALECE